MGLMLEPIVEKPGDGKGSLVAWDPVAKKVQWTVQHDHLWNGGTLATAGGLVFQGLADGAFAAYDARVGKELWHFDSGLGIIGAPSSFSVSGKQYVSVLVGYGGTTAAYGKFMDMGYKFGRQPRRLLTFALGGKAKLPVTPGPDFTVKALDDPKLVLNEVDVATGRALYVQCAACHGVGLQSTGTPAPDLRESAIALNFDAFKTVLKEGALLERGMPRFEMLNDEQIRQIHAYIRAGAREVLGTRTKSNDKAPMPKL
jgi:quinohemoprotein ethanol dehydrogenase